MTPSGRRVAAVLDVEPEGCRAQSLRQLLPQQDLLQLGGRSVLAEGVEDRFSRVRRLLRPRVCQTDGPYGFRGMDDVGGGRRLPRGLRVSRSARGVLGEG
jgi:hypothetical protein